MSAWVVTHLPHSADSPAVEKEATPVLRRPQALALDLDRGGVTQHGASRGMGLKLHTKPGPPTCVLALQGPTPSSPPFPNKPRGESQVTMAMG